MQKLRFGEHEEHPSLVQLQVYNRGMWFVVPGTTTHSTNSVEKSKILNKYQQLLFGNK